MNYKPQSAAANVALNREVQGGDPRNKSGFPTHGIAQQCWRRDAGCKLSAQGLFGWPTPQEDNSIAGHKSNAEYKKRPLTGTIAKMEANLVTEVGEH